MSTVPSTFKQETDVQHAFDLLEQGSWSVAELEAYDRYLDAIRSQKGQLDAARIEARLEEKKSIARELLDVLDSKTIVKKTGLSIEEIEKLSHLRD